MVHVIAEVPPNPVIGLNIEVAVEPGTANTGLYTYIEVVLILNTNHM